MHNWRTSEETKAKISPNPNSSPRSTAPNPRALFLILGALLLILGVMFLILGAQFLTLETLLLITGMNS